MGRARRRGPVTFRKRHPVPPDLAPSQMRGSVSWFNDPSTPIRHSVSARVNLWAKCPARTGLESRCDEGRPPPFPHVQSNRVVARRAPPAHTGRPPTGGRPHRAAGAHPDRSRASLRAELADVRGLDRGVQPISNYVLNSRGGVDAKLSLRVSTTAAIRDKFRSARKAVDRLPQVLRRGATMKPALPVRRQVVLAHEQVGRKIPFGRQGTDHRQGEGTLAVEHLRRPWLGADQRREILLT